MQLQPLYINKVYSDIIPPSEGGGGTPVQRFATTSEYTHLARQSLPQTYDKAHWFIHFEFYVTIYINIKLKSSYFAFFFLTVGKN